MSRNRSNSDPTSAVTSTDDQIPLNSKNMGDGFNVNSFSPLSMKQSKFVGIANQGATCYLNSLLQCLYLTTEFRDSMFEWKYTPNPAVFANEHSSSKEYEFEITVDDMKYSIEEKQEMADVNFKYDAPPEHSIPFQLQLIFARLHHSCRGSITTNALTKSFHWDSRESFKQHDVQELLIVLLDAVRRCFENIGKGYVMNDMFRGTLVDYLRCQSCNDERQRKDTFLDLSLPIEGIDSLEKALDLFITPEIMDGSNQVMCVKCDCLRDFKKGLKFENLPPLLIIQLKRFMFNWEMNRRIKLGHRVTFPKVLDMSHYLTDTTSNVMYDLYCVIIQSGGALGGHYFAYIYSHDENGWFKFNDSVVSPLTDEQFESAYGGSKTHGTGYLLLYRKQMKTDENCNLNGINSSVVDIPHYLLEIVDKEDADIQKRWVKRQKALRTINISLHSQSSNDMISIKVDVEEYTFHSLHAYVRSLFNINDDIISRLRKLYLIYDGFLGRTYDELNEICISSAKWPKNGLHLMLEIKEDDESFAMIDDSNIWVKLFVITKSNMQAIVERGFVQSATFTTQELPAGKSMNTVLIGNESIADIKLIIIELLHTQHLIPDEWLNINILKFTYNSCKVFEDEQLLSSMVRMGDMLFIEQACNEFADTSFSEVSQQFVEQLLKITISFNEPAIVKSGDDRMLDVLRNAMIDNKSSLARKNASRNARRKEIKRPVFNHVIRFNKELCLGQLKTIMASMLSLEVNTFRMRKGSNSKEMKDLSKSVNSHGIIDGGIVYLEYGIPTKTDEICVQFSLYDPSFMFSDPINKKRKLIQNLFEFPFAKNIKVSKMKMELIPILNSFCPLFQGKYDFSSAIKVLRREIRDELRQSLIKNENNTGDEHKSQTVIPTSIACNIFDIQHLRIRKQKGARVKEMLFDNLSLTKNVTARSELQLAIEKCAMKEFFTKSHICFWMRRYRADVGGMNGKLFKAREFVIDKKDTVLHLKEIIVKLCKGTVQLQDISLVKRSGSTLLRTVDVDRMAWPHRQVLEPLGLWTTTSSANPCLTQSHSKMTDEALLANIRIAIAEFDNDMVAKMNGFHLRNGDQVIWQDVTIKITEKQKNKKIKKIKERNERLEKNPNFDPQHKICPKYGSNQKPVVNSVTILTYDEFMKREKEKERAKNETNSNDTNVESDSKENTNVIENENNAQSIIKKAKPKLVKNKSF